MILLNWKLRLPSYGHCKPTGKEGELLIDWAYQEEIELLLHSVGNVEYVWNAVLIGSMSKINRKL